MKTQTNEELIALLAETSRELRDRLLNYVEMMDSMESRMQMEGAGLASLLSKFFWNEFVMVGAVENDLQRELTAYDF